MEKADVYAALGMEAPAEQPEVAEPAAADNTGVKEQPVTGAAAQDDGAVQDGIPAPTGPDGGEKKEMSREERAEQARLRRQREKDEAVQAALAAKQAEFDQQLKEIFETTGMTNRYRDGAKITSKEEFDQWRQDAQAQRLNARLKSGELSAEDLQAAVEATPAMQSVKELQQQIDAQRQAQQQREFQQRIDEEIEQIRTQLDPSVQSLKDILDRPEGAEFARLVNEEGRDFVSAFKLSNFDRLISARQQAAQIGAARSAHSTDHLVAYGQNAGEGVRVPRQTMELYRSLRPDLSEEQIRRDYARRQKRQGN